MQQVTCKVDSQGRITLPSEWRRAHNVTAGSDVTVLVTEDGLAVQTADQSLRGQAPGGQVPASQVRRRPTGRGAEA